MEFGEIMQASREALGYTRMELCRRSNGRLSSSQCTRYERCECVPKTKDLVDLLEKLLNIEKGVLMDAYDKHMRRNAAVRAKTESEIYRKREGCAGCIYYREIAGGVKGCHYASDMYDFGIIAVRGMSVEDCYQKEGTPYKSNKEWEIDREYLTVVKRGRRATRKAAHAVVAEQAIEYKKESKTNL